MQQSARNEFDYREYVRSIHEQFGEAEFSQEDLNPFKWKRIERYADIPKSTSGVYAAIVDSEIIYIGESRDLRKRLQTHGRKTVFNRFGADFYYLPCNQRFLLERTLIKKNKPQLNGTHKKTEPEGLIALY